jgi:hypothetical protein
MQSSRLIRWSGLALLIAGMLIAGAAIFHPSDADPRAFLSPAWVPVHAMFIVGILLTLFGLIGFYRVQADATGGLGLAGFILTSIGNALFVAVLVLDAFVIPAIAADAAGRALLDPAGPLFGGELGVVFLLAGGTFAIGTILSGIATLRAAVLPRWAGLPLLAGGPLLAFTPPLPPLAGIVGAVLLGLGFAWAGYSIWSGARGLALQPKTA